jgi:hypothetical protein
MLDDLMVVAFDPQLGEANRWPERFTLSYPRVLPSSSCFFRHFDLSGLSRERQCWYRNSAAYLVDFAAPTARYPAKPVASAAGQICHLKAKEDYHFFA